MTSVPVEEKDSVCSKVLVDLFVYKASMWKKNEVPPCAA